MSSKEYFDKEEEVIEKRKYRIESLVFKNKRRILS
jgi:hypothetical protein